MPNTKEPHILETWKWHVGLSNTESPLWYTQILTNYSLRELHPCSVAQTAAGGGRWSVCCWSWYHTSATCRTWGKNSTHFNLTEDILIESSALQYLIISSSLSVYMTHITMTLIMKTVHHCSSEVLWYFSHWYWVFWLRKLRMKCDKVRHISIIVSINITDSQIIIDRLYIA